MAPGENDWYSIVTGTDAASAERGSKGEREPDRDRGQRRRAARRHRVTW